MRALRYAVEEAVASLWRGRQSGVLSTATIALALFVLGGFLLVTANLAQLGDEWSSAAEMSVYLKDGVSPADRSAIDRALASTPLIAAHEYVSKDEALTVANVVRLALYARRDEIDIMQLVGAPQAYIRGPFVMEGILQGGIGALASLTALALGFLVLRGRYLAPLASSINLGSVRFL